ncbi:NAD(P)-dependent oxidoreductase [Kibdelosporangium persicum]|uniref:UDP-glucose 4-epimerase n=1 Tax=Kibdelosporangium persicum TaxID=2698649 RepID=A0ABX2F553_9PSEU|nr:NAD-dependent epimerase/dehydratase family protein [Kibdelosporangium persicum]NRN66382.1 UDP-glucose 4-epimerase [Kibdelosporangium persicum]
MQRMDSGRTVLITGGCGFIGTHLATSLSGQGFRVVVADLAPWPDRLVESVRLDIADFPACTEVMRAVDPHVVFHLAASSTIDSAYHDPHGSLVTNVGGTINLLEAARLGASRLERFVFSSTDKVYGELTGDAYVESSPLEARGVYDVGKMSADTLVRLYGSEFELPTAILRLCNVFGPGDPNTGSRIVPRTLSRLFDPAGPQPPVIYEGSIAHGRDYAYVTDVVRALTTIAFDRRAVGETYNMAPAAHRTTLDLVEEMIDQSRRACEPHDRDRADAIRKNGYEVVHGHGMPRALERQHCDGGKISALGFRNVVSMSEGLRRTITSSMREFGIVPESDDDRCQTA